MSVSSVGALFGYINPDAVGGSAPQTVKSADASAAVSTASPSPSSESSAQSDRSGSDSSSPRYAAATGAALISVQERAGTHAPEKGPPVRT